jgi:multidrug efflux pump
MAALREASLTRLRPVLMTSAATVFGHFPLVLVSGPGAEARNSIGTVLVAGMTVGTLFTLFVVPVFYSLIAASHGPGPAPEGFADTDPGGRDGHVARRDGDRELAGAFSLRGSEL